MKARGLRRVTLQVFGIPAPQGSKTPIHRKGKTWLIEGGSPTGRTKHKTWREGVVQAARDYLGEPGAYRYDEPVAVLIGFIFPRPASGPYRTRHVVKPDVDKLIRSTLDGLVLGGLLRDDSLAWAVTATKVYGSDNVGATISIVGDGDEEARDRERLKADARVMRAQCARDARVVKDQVSA